MVEQLRQVCRELLEQGKVNVVIGYGQAHPGRAAYPVFVTRAEDTGQLVWNDQCFSNLTVYLTQPRIKALGKAAIIVKGCDARALVVLEKENQIDRANMIAIGVVCDGVGQPHATKCATCEVHAPRHVDITIGEPSTSSTASTSPGARYAELDAFMQKPPAERLQYWAAELARCVRCYACRQVCPLCYCERCIADKNRPQCIDTSPHLRGNFAWAIARAFHLAARCAGCDECTRACPAGIDLRLLNQSLARAAEQQFDYRPGLDREAVPAVGAYSLQDKEEFIR